MPRGARAQTPGACAAEPASFLDEFLDGVALHRRAATARVAALRDQAAGQAYLVEKAGIKVVQDLINELMMHQPATSVKKMPELIKKAVKSPGSI